MDCQKSGILKMWPHIKTPLWNMYQEVVKQGQLGITSRRGVISLLPKKGKDSRFIKSLRPLALLNLDYKILAKALAARLKKVLPSIIGEQQCGFMEGRQIHACIRKTMDVVANIYKHNKCALIVKHRFPEML